MGSKYKVPVLLSESAGIGRIDEPVAGGIPLKKGFLFDKDDIALFDRKKEVPVQAEALSRWHDNSIRWILLDFRASVRADRTLRLHLQKKKGGKKGDDAIPDKMGRFVKSILISAVDSKGRRYDADLSDFVSETHGRLRISGRYEGSFRNRSKALLDFTARFSFYPGSSMVKLDLTVKNPKAAEHEGGFWDLGDRGSVLFRDLSIRIDPGKECDVLFKETIRRGFRKAGSIALYQDSSGNENWKSRSHAGSDNRVAASFRGYRLYSDNKEIARGNHAQPAVMLKGKDFSLSAGVKDFWQNFPKAIEAGREGMTIRLFPAQSGCLHEMQAGEQKTHTIYFDIEGNSLGWIQQPLAVTSTPEYYAETGAVPYLTPLAESDKRYQRLIDSAIKGKERFEMKNLVIDEYGWRNFGDIYADHEAVHEKGLVSHYNNQYDVINGALLQFFRSRKPEWLSIADSLARHVRDIDIYHTRKDMSAYNGGMFWHTFHYTDAATSTHRSYPRLGAGSMAKFRYGVGGGPSSEHNYATGLMHHYFLTGDILSKEAVISLAEWVVSMDDGSKSRLRFLGHNPTGKASQSVEVYYNGPGRGSGNSINVLMDGYETGRDRKYLSKAEELIRRCIHPKDRIESNDLEDIERRWSYLVFLQALGRYLDLKMEAGQLDFMFYYAKESLLHYAGWILENEVPYKDVLHKADIPSETWPAQDIRKSIVLDYAHKHSGRRIFLRKSEYFFNRCIRDLDAFNTKTCTRPIAILMHYSVMHDYFRKNDAKAVSADKKIDFGMPKRFRPQGYWLFRIRDFVRKVLKCAG